MRLKKLTLLLAAAGACAALPALSQDPYYSNDSRYSPNDSRQDSRYDSRYEQRDYRDNGRYRDDVAQVVDVNPVGGQHEECWNPRANHYEEVRGPDKAKVVSKDTAIGAVAGGVIGHQFDSGAVGTVGGALLGGLAGHAYEQHQNNQETQDDLDRSRCRVVSTGEARDYDVRYRYRGQEWVARMDHPPGDTLVPGRDIAEDGHPYHHP
jgi:uncharacterized protein YcfJ